MKPVVEYSMTLLKQITMSRMGQGVELVALSPVSYIGNSHWIMLHVSASLPGLWWRAMKLSNEASR